MSKISDALRNVTATMRRAMDSGERGTAIDAEDLIQVLLTVADELDPPGNLVLSNGNLVDSACPGCGERHADLLIWQDDDNVRCFGCGTIYQPANPG